MFSAIPDRKMHAGRWWSALTRIESEQGEIMIPVTEEGMEMWKVFIQCKSELVI